MNHWYKNAGVFDGYEELEAVMSSPTSWSCLLCGQCPKDGKPGFQTTDYQELRTHQLYNHRDTVQGWKDIRADKFGENHSHQRCWVMETAHTGKWVDFACSMPIKKSEFTL